MKNFKQYLWNHFGYRLNLQSTRANFPFHWIFLPGGPGLGSEYYLSLITKLQLPGIVWLVDFPGDGSNKKNKLISESDWREGLIDLVHTLQPCILVTHSFSGMFTLSISELERYLSGLIIMNSSPTHKWFSQRQDKLKQVNPHIDKIRERYLKEKTDESFKQLTLDSLKLFFTENEIEEGEKLLRELPYNATYYDQIQNHFHPNFTYQWIPKQIPTLIIGSENDILCPLSFFYEETAFVRDNIQMYSIPKVGHFPWIKGSDEVKTLFEKFIESFQNQSSN